MTVYIVLMRRWGDSNMHSYVIGAFDSMDKAIASANAEEDARGGKYEAWIQPMSLNETKRKTNE